ncbi:maestro heat-like repeat-containing protein family member 9 [Moschus berezovskii]|uniref:maestro heat-like repeat-containing protein family member 9 n=1 Tax=Moschus berezovskii TaxID=68408 RepID=UPI002443A1C9|nr:maestro heat-like repeat-containing protein family member 9 [Moschus berezovskii]
MSVNSRCKPRDNRTAIRIRRAKQIPTFVGTLNSKSKDVESSQVLILRIFEDTAIIDTPQCWKAKEFYDQSKSEAVSGLPRTYTTYLHPLAPPRNLKALHWAVIRNSTTVMVCPPTYNQSSSTVATADNRDEGNDIRSNYDSIQDTGWRTKVRARNTSIVANGKLPLALVPTLPSSVNSNPLCGLRTALNAPPITDTFGPNMSLLLHFHPSLRQASIGAKSGADSIVGWSGNPSSTDLGLSPIRSVPVEDIQNGEVVLNFPIRKREAVFVEKLDAQGSRTREKRTIGGQKGLCLFTGPDRALKSSWKVVKKAGISESEKVCIFQLNDRMLQERTQIGVLRVYQECSWEVNQKECTDWVEDRMKKSIADLIIFIDQTSSRTFNLQVVWIPGGGLLRAVDYRYTWADCGMAYTHKGLLLQISNQAAWTLQLHPKWKFPDPETNWRDMDVRASVNAPCLGVLAAELSLLCSHSDPAFTQQAFVGMYHLLCIAKCQSEGAAKSKNKKYDKPENHFIQSSSSGTEFLPKNLQKDKSKIAQSVGKTLLPPLLTDFVWSLLMKLSVPDQTIASEAATILKLTLECNAHKVTMVSKIVDTIYKQLCGDDSPILREAMLRVITLLTRTSPKKVIFQLMDYPVPADDILILMWYAAGSESSVVPHVLKTILLILKGKPREMEKIITERKHFSLNATNMMPVAASQALCTLLPLGPYKKAVAQFFPQLLMALMLQLFYSSNLRLMTEDRHFYARDALRVLLNCSGLQEVDTALKRKNCWHQFSQVLFHHHGVYLVAKTLSEYNFPQFPETLHYLYKLAVEGPRRSEDSVITIIFLTELLNNFFKDPFPEKFLVLFRNWINDPDPAVCKLSLQKIASMAPVINKIENVCSLLTSILDAFLSKDTTVTIRALITLRKLLDRLDKVTYSSLSTRIASSYCPLMDHGNEGIRSMAIHHFGQLLMDMSQYTWMLNDVVYAGLVPLILFLEDTEEGVVKACKYTLNICASELKWSTSYFLKDEYYNFELVVLNICNNLLISHQKYITDLISETLGFLESSRTYLRRGSVILLGYLAKLGGHLLLRDEIDVMLEAIDRVIRDEDPVIRELAEKTNKIFMEIAHKLTTSNIKQSFQRLFNFIYLKKLKLLYNYNLPKDLRGSPMQIKEIRNDKEAIINDNYEDGLDSKGRAICRGSQCLHLELTMAAVTQACLQSFCRWCLVAQEHSQGKRIFWWSHPSPRVLPINGALHPGKSGVLLSTHSVATAQPLQAVSTQSVRVLSLGLTSEA